MRKWASFVGTAFLNGWAWLVEVGNHAGVALAVLGVLGSGFLAVQIESWWYAAVYLIGVAFLAFSVGAYRTYNEAQKQTGEAFSVSLLATLNQLHAKRAQATGWLRMIREEDYGETSLNAIDQVFSLFWTDEVRDIVQTRASRMVSKLDDQSDPLLPEPDERTAVFNKIQRAVKLVDEVVAEINATYVFIQEHIGPRPAA